MKIVDIATTANQNLKRSKLRTFLTILAISIGTFTLALSLGLGEGVRGYIASQLGQYENINIYFVERETGGSGGSNNPFVASGDPQEYREQNVTGSAQFSMLYTDADLEKIKGIDGVKDIRPFFNIALSYVTDPSGKRYQAPAEQFVPEIPQNVISGKTLEGSDNEGLLISRKFLKIAGVSNSDEAVGKNLEFSFSTQSGETETVRLTIRGVFEPTIGDMPFKIPESVARSVVEKQNASLAQVYPAVFISKEDGFDEAQLKTNFKNEKFKITSFQEINALLNNIITGVQVALGAFSSIAILASIVGVINTLFMAVLERTHEIGLFRALGAKRKTIFALFSFEAALIGFWGSVVGLILAFIAQFGINSYASATFLKGVEGLQLLDITLPLIGFIVVGIALVTLLAGLIPAFKASKLDPIEALRYE